MMNRTFIRVAAVAPLAMLLAACQKDVLSVANVNSPDVTRVYATAASIEGVISTGYQQLFASSSGGATATGSTAEGLHTQAHAASLEVYGSVANFGLNTRESIPRVAIFNDRGNSVQTGNTRDWTALSKLTRTASTGVQSLDRLTAAKGTLGSPAQDARARSFGFFVNGAALGYLAMGYDSAAIVTPAVPSDVVPKLSSYADAGKAAIRSLDSALAIASSANATNGANGWPLPGGWISGSAMTLDQYIRFVKSHRARIRAALARTPAERAAVDWTSVIADATTGITADFVIQINNSLGWACAYDCNQLNVSAGWGQVSPYYYGMADTSGFYARWIAQPVNQRDGSGLIITPDQRWPQGATRAAQTADSPLPLAGRRYFRNHPVGEDVSGDPWGSSNYFFRRWWGVSNAGNIGPYVSMSKVEMDMLAAEGYIRAGSFASAAALIDASRAKNGLPSIGPITSASQQIAGGTGCVPQVPQAPAFNTVGCGTILEAMKYEKRMETAMTGYMAWFTDSRGWGDLIEGTALQWPVPNGEMDSRVQAFYNLGGIGGKSAAPKGTYGF
jgi:hypothetical protein